MPAGAEDDADLLILLLDQGLYGGMAGHAFGIGILRKIAEAQTERLLIAMGDGLVAEIDHLVAEEGRADLRELLGAEGGEIDAANLRAHCGGERLHLDD